MKTKGTCFVFLELLTTCHGFPLQMEFDDHLSISMATERAPPAGGDLSVVENAGKWILSEAVKP